MTHPIGTYTFLPWLRGGIANNVTAVDGDATVRLRSTVPVAFTVKGEGLGGTPTAPVSKPVQLYGPGDVVGIDPRAIVKNEPRHWITNFEPNYLPFVEFYDEDFAWRYTPAAPDVARERLRPWITLVVLTEDEFEEGVGVGDRPLPYVTVADPAASFPRADQLWAWAHVHVNGSLGDQVVAPDAAMPGVLAALTALVASNPDRASCRLLCPRKLAPQQGYHAFVVPTFESGRLAGLGHDPGAAPAAVHATFSAWAGYAGQPEAGAFPYYHRWFFQTGTLGDFEYLVRLLQPRPMDSRVGQRDVDVQNPGSNVGGITDADLGGILRLGGALRVPQKTLSEAARAEADKYEEWDDPYPHTFQRDLAAFVNLADDYVDPTVPPDPDPLVTAPLYGRWHALTQRLLSQPDGSDAPNRTNWVHELNLDPRFRLPAGFGTEVVKANQEKYMDAAWGQVGDIVAANERIRRAQLAIEAASVWHERIVTRVYRNDPERTFVLTAPVHRVVLASGLTVGYRTRESALPRAVVSAPFRRITRPGGPVGKALGLTGDQAPERLVGRVNRGEVTAAPPKATPPGLTTTGDLADELAPAGAPRAVLDLLARYPWLRWLPLVVLLVLVLLLLLLAPVALAVVAVAAVAVPLLAWYRRLAEWTRRARATERLRPEGQTPEAVDDLPRSPDFRLTAPDDPFRPATGATDSAEAVRFKAALRESYGLLQASAVAGAEPVRRPLDVAAQVDATVAAIDPTVSIPRRVLDSIRLPDRVAVGPAEVFREAMAYPEFDLPMYKPLVGLGDEYFLPNLNLIPPNTISLLETNQRFIEAYLVGLNHELARELLWREYPTDQRGSYFRQFWDVTPFLAAAGGDVDELREKLRDIPPLDRWSRTSKLGDHDHRERPGGAPEEDLVLVVRGELLKKYPTAVIYAQQAQWQTKVVDGVTVIDPAKPRRPVDLTPAEEDDPPRDKVKTPLYEAQVAPDVYFFGFDLTDVQARGGTGEDPDDDAGWFFVIKERPGEPRFGLDLDGADNPHFWNDLSWRDVIGAGPDGSHIVVGDLAGFTLTAPPGGTTDEDEVRAAQHAEDVQVGWDAGSNAADLAYVLYQVPVLVAVHAAEMLPKP